MKVMLRPDQCILFVSVLITHNSYKPLKTTEVVSAFTFSNYTRHELSDQYTNAIANSIIDNDKFMEFRNVLGAIRGEDNRMVFTGTKGTIVGILPNFTFLGTYSYLCYFTLIVPTGNIILIKVRFHNDQCWDDMFISTEAPDVYTFQCRDGAEQPSRAWFTTSNRIEFTLVDYSLHADSPPSFIVTFQAVPEVARSNFRVQETSPLSGSLTAFGFEGSNEVPCGTDASYILTLTAGHVVLVSFPVLKWNKNDPLVRLFGDMYNVSKPFVELFKATSIGSPPLCSPSSICWKSCLVSSAICDTRHSTAIPANVYDNDLLIRVRTLSIWTLSNRIFQTTAMFKMLYTFFPTSDAPGKSRNGRFNCSGPAYDSFRQHLDCNLELECQGGEDERADCPYSSAACKGDVATTGKCYRYISWGKDLLWKEARSECHKLGGDLATVKMKQEFHDFLKLFDFGKRQALAYVGLRSSTLKLHGMYRSMYTWVDDTVCYDFNLVVREPLLIIPKLRFSFSNQICSFFSVDLKNAIQLYQCEVNDMSVQDFVCEFQTDASVAQPRRELIFPSLDPSSFPHRTNQSLTICPDGHLTHVFMSCDKASSCETKRHLSHCTTIDQTTETHVVTFTFPCDDLKSTVPYTLVCDFRPDCPDRSDEDFCLISDGQCAGFRCRNGQCIRAAQRCDRQRDCWDGSDEGCGTVILTDFHSTYRTRPPALVHFDGSGNFTQEPWDARRPCPETHFRCPQGYCLPVYVRCNGVLDCPGREDETDCLSFTCPGFYRCRASTVCVHSQHLCDGWPQCPQHDDELLCRAICPDACTCQGLSFVCPRPFPATRFPELRYLDASGSGMTPDNLTQNVNLVWLSLASCRLKDLSITNFQNLRIFNLSHNHFKSFILSSLVSLRKLRILILSDNPLVSLLNVSPGTSQTVLSILDLSNTRLSEFVSAPLSDFPNIMALNLSYCLLNATTNESFQHMQKLKELDLRGNTIVQFSDNFLKGLVHLRRLSVDNYKLCCKQILPDAFGDGVCSAPQDEISSCDDLLRADVYRVFLWLFAVLSGLGNAACIIFRLFFQKGAPSGFSVFVTNLSLADFLMGVFLTIVGAADIVYRGQYLSFDNVWKTSVACKIAGFLSLMSSKVSAFTISLITLDRFLVFNFPFSRTHLKRTLVSAVCGIAWAVGFVIATVPLLPVTSEWQFYSQSGICIPLPITRKTFRGRDYAFAVMIVLNLALFLLIAVGQACIYCTIRVNSVNRESSRKSKELVVARRLTSVVVSDFLCWFPIGVLGLLASRGVSVPSEVNVGMAIFVLPLNSALNPFLYTFNALIDRRRRAKDEKILKQLERLAVTGSTLCMMLK